ncbi:MAG: hypothetical protein U0528_11990 [Anaerolineae bacterium]|nr:hypothetical protein [Anaerolineae bacterium]
MSPKNTRIIVVDRKQETYQVVRGALDLMERHPRMIHTHTPEDALAELRASGADLLVTAQALQAGDDGLELALAAKRELAALTVAVIAEGDDPEIEGAAESTLFTYLRRPFIPESFLRIVRLALDGPEAVAAEPAAAAKEVLIPVPEIDTTRLHPPLFQLLRDVSAMAVVLANRHGKVITYEGAAGYVDRDLIAVAVSHSMQGLPRIMPIVGEQPRMLQFFDGDKRDLFVLALGLHYFVVLIFEGNEPAAALGKVRSFGFSAINAMLNLMSLEVAYSTKMLPTTAAKRDTGELHLPRRRRTQEINISAGLGVLPTVPAPRPDQVRQESKPRAAEPEPMLDPIPNFDPNILDNLGELDLSAADDLFNDSAVQQTLRRNDGPRISFEDAMMQGIISGLEEDQ